MATQEDDFRLALAGEAEIRHRVDDPEFLRFGRRVDHRLMHETACFAVRQMRPAAIEVGRHVADDPEGERPFVRLRLAHHRVHRGRRQMEQEARIVIGATIVAGQEEHGAGVVTVGRPGAGAVTCRPGDRPCARAKPGAARRATAARAPRRGRTRLTRRR